MAHYVDFDWALPPRKRRIEVEAPPKPNPPREVENSGNEWTVVTSKVRPSTPSLPPPKSQVKKYTYLSESELGKILSAHMKPQHGNRIKMAYLEGKTPTELTTEMVGQKGFSLAQIKKFYTIFRTETPL
jgi:hypothetical protein